MLDADSPSPAIPQGPQQMVNAIGQVTTDSVSLHSTVLESVTRSASIVCKLSASEEHIVDSQQQRLANLET